MIPIAMYHTFDRRTLNFWINPYKGKVEIIEIAVNPDHVHIFFKYPPKYSLSFIAKRLKGRTSRILRKEFPHLKEWCGEHMWAPSCFHGSVGNGWEVVEKYIQTQDKHHAKPTTTGLGT